MQTRSKCICCILIVLAILVIPYRGEAKYGRNSTRSHISDPAFSDYKLTSLSTLDDVVASCFNVFTSTGNRKKYSVVIGSLLTSYLGNLGDDEKILGLEDLLEIGLDNNQLIEIDRQKFLQSKGQLTQAWSGYLPQIGLGGRYSYTEQKDSGASTGTVETTGDGEVIETFESETEEDNVLHGSASFSQLIYDFGKTTGEISIGKSNLLASDHRLTRKIQDIVFQVKKAYYDVLEKRRLIDVAIESEKNFKQHLSQANIYYKAGIRTKIDVINAEVELSNATMRLLRAEYDLKAARVALEQVLGIQPNKGKYFLRSDDVQLDTILQSMPVISGPLESLIQNALEARPDILQFQMLTRAAEANVGRSKGDYWPRITTEANYNDYDTDLSLYKDSWEVGVAATWDLFSGLRTKGAVAEARSKLSEQRAAYQDLRLAVVREVTETYLEADENRKSVQIALQTLELAKENLVLAAKRYKSGSYDVVEFNDAQLTLTRTRNELVVTYYGYLTALAAIDFAVGEELKKMP